VILDIQSVTKAYASKLAVDRISLQIPAGVIFGLLGPNGAGKTTLIRMITRITMPDSGLIYFRGEPMLDEHQQFIGYLPEERGLYRKMKVGEHVEYLLRLRGLNKADAVQAVDYWLERLALAGWKNNKVEELSKGMQQKVQFIATVAHQPPLLILDEPFSGLDPVNSLIIEEIIQEIKQKGTTIIFSTHRLEQVEQMCERIGLVNNGQLVLHDDVKAVRKRYRTNRYVIEFEANASDVMVPASLATIVERQGAVVHFQLQTGATLKELVSHCLDQQPIIRFEEVIPSLSDIFIDVVKNQPQLATSSN
jgi:ABC-2 type transport system ATP-binding protein